jgi:hypothetical protein
MKTKNIVIGVVILAAVVVAAIAMNLINVKGEVKLPEVSADVKGGELPEVNVEKGALPDVDVDVKGGELPEVETPDVDVNVEEKPLTIPVPDVEITTPEEKE